MADDYQEQIYFPISNITLMLLLSFPHKKHLVNCNRF